MSTVYKCKAPGCRAGVVSHADHGPEFFCRTAGMNEHFCRDDGTNAFVSDECSPACRYLDDYFFHDAACAGRLVGRERTRPGLAHPWDEWWRAFLEHVVEHCVGYGGSY
jgi:hypothetical protein